MLLIARIACVLVAVTAAMNAVGLVVMLKAFARSHALSTTGYHHITWLLIGLSLWRGLFYFWQGCMPDAESAFYFAGVS
jgi:hypothetical protein